ncbi:MAG TPA: hypothetical protein VHX49_07345 [Candidatus Acidoferrales bacterium]|nr:hypothetical protein [Candidatus Acidoferrales bacterium]
MIAMHVEGVTAAKVGAVAVLRNAVIASIPARPVVRHFGTTLVPILVVRPVNGLALVLFLLPFLLVLRLFLLGLFLILLGLLVVFLGLLIGLLLLLRLLIILMARSGFGSCWSFLGSFGGLVGWPFGGSFARLIGGLCRSIRGLRGGFLFVVGLLLSVDRSCCEHAQNCCSHE